MSVLNIRNAQREGARMVIVLAGPTGCGKTRSALEIAYGLVNYKPELIGFIDTENRRGSLKADVFQKDRKTISMTPFKIGDLFAPFSPDRYAEAVREFQAAGVKCLIVDSGSHEWEGIGGCQDIAEAGNPRLPNWNKAKTAHKRFMNILLTCDMHIILCLRAREKAKPEKQIINGVEKTVYVDQGMEPITEKNVMFEATISLMMSDGGLTQRVVKMEPELFPILGRGTGYITDVDGEALANWISGGKQLDPDVERQRNILISMAEKGIEALKAEWEATPVKIKTALGVPFLNTCKASAAEFEKQAAEASGIDEETAQLNTLLANTGNIGPNAGETNPSDHVHSGKDGDKTEAPETPAADPPAETGKPAGEKEKAKPTRKAAAKTIKEPEPETKTPEKVEPAAKSEPAPAKKENFNIF